MYKQILYVWKKKKITSRMLTHSSNSTMFFDLCLDVLQKKKFPFFFICLYHCEEEKNKKHLLLQLLQCFPLHHPF